MHCPPEVEYEGRACNDRGEVTPLRSPGPALPGVRLTARSNRRRVLPFLLHPPHWQAVSTGKRGGDTAS